MNRRARTMAFFAACVLLLHVGALWALHKGLLSRTPDVVQPAPLLARMLEPQSRATAAPPSSLSAPPSSPSLSPSPLPANAAPRPSAPERRAMAPQPAPTRNASPASREPGAALSNLPPEPAPVLAPVAPSERPPPPTDGRPSAASPAKPAATIGPVTTASTKTGAATSVGQTVDPAEEKAALSLGHASALAASPLGATAVAAPTTRQPAAVELPSSDAQYLRNPRPRYPPISVRLREEGTVLVDVLVSDQGLAQEARIRTSSGFFRLDNTALSTVLTWRFVPGKRAGVAQSMWFTVPITFDIQPTNGS